MKTVNKTRLIIPTDEEDARINAGIASDPDTYELSAEEFKKLRPLRGRPAGSGDKEQITLRIDKDMLDLFRKTGAGWQTRINAALRNYVSSDHDLSKLNK